MKKIIIAVCLIVSSTAFAGEAEIYVCGGRAISNSVADLKSNSWCLGQITPTKFGTWNFGYLNEGHQNGDKRDGVFALPQFSYNLTKNLETSIAIGPYFTATTITEPDGIHYQDKYRWAGLGFAKIRYQLTEHVSIAGEWGHVMYRRDNKDADVFEAVAGYKF